MVFSIVIDCEDIDLNQFEVLDVRAQIYLVRSNQELGPVIIRLNDNFRVVENVENLADQEVIISFFNFSFAL